MTQTYNVYCDESCHLEHDNQLAMVLGAVWCPLDHTREILERLREIRVRHSLSLRFETKWTKVSPGKVQYYLDLMDYFFDDDDLHFRALIVPDKSKLQHSIRNQTHDDWYYRMYFDMLKIIIDPLSHYRIYLDIKDTRGAKKVHKLHEVLSNANYDFSRSIIDWIQLVPSREVELVQLADLLIGAVSYTNRELDTSTAKTQLVRRMQQRSGYTLRRTTLPSEKKVNLFRWHAQEGL
jgi:hypothetical protein